MYGIAVYHIAFLLSSFLAFVSTKKIVCFSSKARQYSFLLGFCYLIILLLNGTRDGVGTDYEHYTWVFNIARKGEVYAIVEPGYWFINVLFKNFEYGHRFVLGLMCTMTYLVFFLLAKEEKVIPLLIPFLFSFGFIFFSNNIVRQSFAITLFIYSIRYIERKKFWKYLVSVLIIFLFHTSAILLIPFYWIGKIRLNKSYWIIMIFSSVIMYRLNIFHIVIRSIASLIPKYKHFIGLAGHDEFQGGMGLSMILLIFLGISVALFAKYMQNNKRHQIYFNLFMIGICFSIMLFSSAYFYRFTFYLFYIILLLIPILIKNIEKKNMKRIVFTFFFFLSLIWWVKVLLFNDGDPLPYQSFLF